MAQPKFVRLPDKAKEDVCESLNYPTNPRDLITIIASENNINENETLLILIAVSRLETGNWTSTAYEELNNFGGLSENERPMAFDSRIKGCRAFVENLIENYIEEGLTTPESIGSKYCPVNSEWPELIKEIMEEEHELL